MNISYRTIENGTKKVKSLVWDGDELVDWCQGGVRWDADGKRHESRIMTAYDFDAAIVSPSLKYYCIYTRTATKAVIGRTKTRKHLREINRSYYFANVYEFPIAFAVLGDGREVIIYCPEEYNRLEIEDVETGERLGYSGLRLPSTGSESSESPTSDEGGMGENREPGEADGSIRSPCDVFHSRLSVSPSGKWLLSNGWYWHPHETAELFRLDECVCDARLLDKKKFTHPGCPLAQSASFIDDDRLLLGLGEGWYDAQGDETRGQTTKQPINSLAIWRIGEESYQQMIHLERQTGTLLSITENLVLDLFGHPKIFDMTDGRLVDEWPEINSGHQASCITRDKHPPPIAFDPPRRLLAVHSQEKIHVLSFEVR